jgi:hypothetical protein
MILEDCANGEAQERFVNRSWKKIYLISELRPHNDHGVGQVQFPDIGVIRGKKTTEELITTESTDSIRTFDTTGMIPCSRVGG